MFTLLQIEGCPEDVPTLDSKTQLLLYRKWKDANMWETVNLYNIILTFKKLYFNLSDTLRTSWIYLFSSSFDQDKHLFLCLKREDDNTWETVKCLPMLTFKKYTCKGNVSLSEILRFTLPCNITFILGTPWVFQVEIHERAYMQRKGISFVDIEMLTLAIWRTPLDFLIVHTISLPSSNMWTNIHAKERHFFRRYWNVHSCNLTDAPGLPHCSPQESTE